MFSKVFNKQRKAEKKARRAIEDAKSQEQKDYEAMQQANIKEAEKVAAFCTRRLFELGYRFQPIIQPMGNGSIAAAALVFASLDFNTYKREKEQTEKMLAEQEAKNGKLEEPKELSENTNKEPVGEGSTVGEGSAE